MAEVTKAEADKTADTKAKAPTHIRFVGHPSSDEHSSTEVFGKKFFRGKWVPLTNLDGSNPEKKALSEAELTKLVGNPAFELGDGKESPVPGAGDDTEQRPSEEA